MPKMLYKIPFYISIIQETPFAFFILVLQIGQNLFINFEKYSFAVICFHIVAFLIIKRTTFVAFFIRGRLYGGQRITPNILLPHLWWAAVHPSIALMVLLLYAKSQAFAIIFIKFSERVSIDFLNISIMQNFFHQNSTKYLT